MVMHHHFITKEKGGGGERGNGEGENCKMEYFPRKWLELCCFQEKRKKTETELKISSGKKINKRNDCFFLMFFIVLLFKNLVCY